LRNPAGMNRQDAKDAKREEKAKKVSSPCFLASLASWRF
jgi:hypothetical protein